MSKVIAAGPMIEPVAAFPKNPGAGATNALVLNHCATVLGPLRLVTPTRLGRVANPGVATESPGSIGNPLWTEVTSEYCQFPSSRFLHPFSCEYHGVLHMALMEKIWDGVALVGPRSLRKWYESCGV